MYRGLITLSIVYWYGVFRVANIINYMMSKIIKATQKSALIKTNQIVSF
jgi:hypothetical protein